MEKLMLPENTEKRISKNGFQQQKREGERNCKGFNDISTKAFPSVGITKWLSQLHSTGHA